MALKNLRPLDAASGFYGGNWNFDVGSGGGGFPTDFWGFGDIGDFFTGGFVSGRGPTSPSGGTGPEVTWPTIGPEFGITFPTIGGVAGTVGGAVGSAIGAATGLGPVYQAITNIDWLRIACFILGLILIAGGLYLLKPVQEVVNTTVSREAEAIAA